MRKRDRLPVHSLAILQKPDYIVDGYAGALQPGIAAAHAWCPDNIAVCLGCLIHAASIGHCGPLAQYVVVAHGSWIGLTDGASATAADRRRTMLG